jgi:hypothetical protein
MNRMLAVRFVDQCNYDRKYCTKTIIHGQDESNWFELRDGIGSIQRSEYTKCFNQNRNFHSIKM